MKKLTLQEIKDTLVGCTILGTGGGGSLESGLEAIEKAWNAGHEFKLLSFDEINDDSYYANPYYCGSIVPKGDNSQKRGDEIATSVKALEEYMGVQFEGLVSIEYGGGNTGAVMAAAARTGKYIVDADAAGRAVPELQFSTYYVTENPITPFSVGTSFGDMAIVTNVENDARAEALSRYMAIGSGGLVGMTDHPIKGDKLRHAVIPNALTYAATVGRAQREAVERGSDPIQAILDTGKGKLLFQGTVTGESEWGIKEGFTVGTIHIAGEGAFAHQTSKIWYKNENMVVLCRLLCRLLRRIIDRGGLGYLLRFGRLTGVLSVCGSVADADAQRQQDQHKGQEPDVCGTALDAPAFFSCQSLHRSILLSFPYPTAGAVVVGASLPAAR